MKLRGHLKIGLLITLQNRPEASLPIDPQRRRVTHSIIPALKEPYFNPLSAHGPDIISYRERSAYKRTKPSRHQPLPCPSIV
jgi:hypothetical protein